MSSRQKRRYRVRSLWRKRLKEAAMLVEGAQIRDYGWLLMIPLYKGEMRHAITIHAAFARKLTARGIVTKTARFAATAGYKVGVLPSAGSSVG